MTTAAEVAEAAAQRVAATYAAAEQRLLRQIARRSYTGATTMTFTEWTAHKAAETRLLRISAASLAGDLTGDIARVLEAEALAAYQAGRAAVPIIGTPRAVVNIATEAAAGTRVAHLGMLRWTQDVFRRVQAEVGQLMGTGTITLPEAIQVGLNRYAAAGVRGFIDRAGRSWGLQEYGEMATRTVTARAHLNGTIDRMKDQGRNLVMVSTSPEPCPWCSPWEGQVLALEPDGEHPTVDEAEADGLFHPNCTHGLGAFIEGLTQPPPESGDPEGYELRQTQRYHERQVRAAQRHQAVAVTPDAKQRAAQRLDKARGRYTSFVAEHDRIPTPWRLRVMEPSS